MSELSLKGLEEAAAAHAVLTEEMIRCVVCGAGRPWPITICGEPAWLGGCDWFCHFLRNSGPNGLQRQQ